MKITGGVMKSTIAVYRIMMKSKQTIVIMFSIILYSILSFVIPLINGKLVDVLLEEDIERFIMLVLLFLIVSLIMSVVNYIAVKYINKAQIDLSTKMKDKTIAIIENSSKIDREKIGSSEFQTRINEINNVENIISQNVYKLVISVVTMIMVLLYLSEISLGLLLVSIAIIPMYYYLNKKSFDSLNRVTVENAQENIKFLSKANAFFSRVDFLRLNKRLEGEREKLQEELINFSNVRRSLLIKSNQTVSMISILNTISIVLLMIILGYEYSLGKVSIGQFVTVLQYFSYVTAPVVLLSTINVSIQPGLVAYDRNIEFNKKFPPRSKVRKEKLSSDVRCIKIDSPKFEGRIFKNFELEAKIGECLEIRGGNGSGKSTLLQLIAQNYDVENENSIKLNDLDIKLLNMEDLENSIFFMEQEIEIIDGTLLDNLFIDEKIISDLTTDELIKPMYEELSVQIKGNRTSQDLSLGQRKKVALLRLFVSEKKVLLLDEAESSLDDIGKKTLEKILKRKQAEDCIIIRVTHDNERG